VDSVDPCGVALAAFAQCFQAGSVMQVVVQIKAGELDPYKALEQYVSHLAGHGLAPKPISDYLTANQPQ